jgi:lysophospholipase L1-like esterase
MRAVQAGSSHAVLAFSGDSTTHGWADGTTGLAANSVPGKVAAKLAAAGVPAENDSIFGLGGEPTLAAQALWDTRLAFGAGWVPSTIISLGGKAIANNTTTNALSFTPSNAWDTAEVWFQGQTGVACPITFDVGGATTSATTTASTFTRVTYSPGTNAVQTLNIKRNTAGSEVLTVIGIHCYDSATKRVAVFNFGVAGATSTDLANAAAASSANNAYTTVVSGALGGVSAAGCLSAGINDYRASTLVALETYVSNLRTLIATRKSIGDLIGFVPVPSKIADTAQATQDSYDNEFRAQVMNGGIPTYDVPVAWSYWIGANASGLFGSDNLHPSVAGYDDIATKLVTLLTQ